jgi:dihydropyrimidinase
MKMLVKGGTLVTASEIYQSDVLIDDGLITLIGKDLDSAVQADTVVDATGKLVIPGGIDVHTHLDMPFGGTYSVDDFETGTIAAAFGGTTSIVDFAIQNYGGSLHTALEDWHKKAEGKAAIDYGFHMIVREINPQVLA